MLGRRPVSSLFKKSSNQISKHYPVKNSKKNLHLKDEFLLNINTRGYNISCRSNSLIKEGNRIYISRINNFSRKYHTTRHLNGSGNSMYKNRFKAFNLRYKINYKYL